MAKKRPTPASSGLSVDLMRWSEHVPSSEAQDPLGLALRGSGRLASQLLHCITSITPRARYFSFLPWCIHDWQQRERGLPGAVGLKEAIVLRERALVLGCLVLHQGTPCDGGALVGSESLTKWLAKGATEADLRKIPFAKNPAFGAYQNSLINLGFFKETPREAVDADAPETGDDEALFESLTLEDLELSERGLALAEAFGNAVGRLKATVQLSERRPRVNVSSLRSLGEKGGFCELADNSAPDRNVLRDIFFAHGPTAPSGGHRLRRDSLLLVLELVRQLGALGVDVGEDQFDAAVYFGQVSREDGPVVSIVWPAPLADIAERWRMFYFHHYMSVALEGLFSWVLGQATDKGLQGISADDLLRNLDSEETSKSLSDLLGLTLRGAFSAMTPAETFRAFTTGTPQPIATASAAVDAKVLLEHPCSEFQLETIIRDREFSQTRSGLSTALLLLALSLARFARWEDSKVANWLASAARDPWVDVVPPVMMSSLSRSLGDWWTRPWADIARFVINRHVVQQHLAMSFERTAGGERCLLHVEGPKIVASGTYDKIGMGNARLRSAIQVLHDLGLVRFSAADVTILTGDGRRLLAEQLGRGGNE